MLTGHDRAVLQFSGGKDSTALMHVARPWLDRIRVVFCDPGHTLPHVLAHVHATCRALGVKLDLIEHDEKIEAFHERVGLPSDIVPAWSAPDAAWIVSAGVPQRLQSPVNCCGRRLYDPMTAYIRDSGTTLVLRGSKKADIRVGVPDGHVEDGVEYRSPLWGWTDEDVYRFHREHGIAIPAHYAAGAAGGVNDSLDCWSCTGHLTFGTGAGRIRYVREHYPELWPELYRRLGAVRGAIAAEQARMDAAILGGLEA